MSVQIEFAYRQLVDPAALRHLHAVAAGQARDSEGRLRAIAALPFVDAANAKSALMRLIEDGTNSARVRLLATESFTRLPLAQILPELKRYAGDRDLRVAAAAVTALGQKGTAEAITVIEPLKSSGDPVLSGRATFAAALLAHRFQLEGHNLLAHIHDNFLALPARTLPVAIQPVSANDLAAARTTLGRAAISFEPHNNAWDVVCGSRRYMILVDRTAAEISDAAEFIRAKRYIGQLAFRNPTNGAYSLGLAILLTPTEANNAALGLYRVDGTLVLGGESRLDGDQIAFALSATDRPGAAPVRIKGYFGPRGLAVDTAVSAGRARQARRPAPGKGVGV